MNKKWFRNLLRGLSFTSAMFVFQACYGTPQDMGLDTLLEGQVKSSTDDSPIPGIKVSCDMQYIYTDEEGNFSMYVQAYENLTLSFEDVDTLRNGHFVNTDTVIIRDEKKIWLNIKMDEQP